MSCNNIGELPADMGEAATAARPGSADRRADLPRNAIGTLGALQQDLEENHRDTEAQRRKRLRAATAQS
jgi:hypothetical protein